MDKDRLEFEVRWMIDEEKNQRGFATFNTEAEAKEKAQEASTEFEFAQIGVIETDLKGVKKLTHAFTYEAGKQTKSEERNEVMETATETTKGKSGKAKAPAKKAMAKKGKAAKAPTTKANGKAKVAKPAVPVKAKGPMNLTTIDGVLEAFECRGGTVRDKLIRTLYKNLGKHVSVDKLRVACYGDEIEHNQPVMMSMLGMKKSIEALKLPFKLDKVKNGKEVAWALVKTK